LDLVIAALIYWFSSEEILNLSLGSFKTVSSPAMLLSNAFFAQPFVGTSYLQWCNCQYTIFINSKTYIKRMTVRTEERGKIQRDITNQVTIVTGSSFLLDRHQIIEYS
jgi:hypothetical protein